MSNIRGKKWLTIGTAGMLSLAVLAAGCSSTSTPASTTTTDKKPTDQPKAAAEPPKLQSLTYWVPLASNVAATLKSFGDMTVTFEEMKVRTRAWFLTLGHYLNESCIRNSPKLSEHIIKFIEQYYGNEMLSLTMIAEPFQLTPPYLSGLFKKQTGMNLTDYLTRLRIDEAKKLMTDKKLTFTQIANKVGYTSDIGFIRVFKKRSQRHV
ncbi:helix-turn-helix domain-containing protein [Paenibacillus cremeus]|uniref:Helix-turn-helix transcriptional regulator n=1 Tax=Paenibacillus cremeus TaxID=2163881 RepID=A0A559K9M8_9BACL|nr:AraC family transcriptional regulator [Paenibacillus cremeus]TVY08841.1 helix-turn-helix transcriptional regulator [Paenibacillus cremeus]